MRSERIILYLLAVTAMVAVMSCSSKATEHQQDVEVLVSVGDSSLTMQQVLEQIPRDLSGVDSATLFNQIVENWIRSMVLTEVAEKNIPDMDRIDRMVEQYRNSLIVKEYLTTVAGRKDDAVSDEEIREYYDVNHAEMLLDQPLIKGAYLKVSERDENLDNLRRWMSQFNESSIDKIEKSGLRQASQYKYFKDEWHEWNSVAEQIPYRFFDADAFVKSTRDFETNENGSVYLLHISEYIPSGQEMPWEFAKMKIREILLTQEMLNRRSRLVDDIYERQISAGILKAGLYDPLKHELKQSVSQTGNKSGTKRAAN